MKVNRQFTLTSTEKPRIIGTKHWTNMVKQ